MKAWVRALQPSRVRAFLPLNSFEKDQVKHFSGHLFPSSFQSRHICPAIMVRKVRDYNHRHFSEHISLSGIPKKHHEVCFLPSSTWVIDNMGRGLFATRISMGWAEPAQVLLTLNLGPALPGLLPRLITP